MAARSPLAPPAVSPGANSDEVKKVNFFFRLSEKETAVDLRAQCRPDAPLLYSRSRSRTPGDVDLRGSPTDRRRVQVDLRGNPAMTPRRRWSSAEPNQAEKVTAAFEQFGEVAACEVFSYWGAGVGPARTI